MNLRRAGVVNKLYRVRDGQEAIDALFGKNPIIKDLVHPSSFLLILDINMPRVDGMEVLRQIKLNRVTALAPVIVLTTTDDPREIQRCYELGCNVYVTKPVAYDSFVEAIRRIGLFLQIIAMPLVNTASLKRLQTL